MAAHESSKRVACKCRSGICRGAAALVIAVCLCGCNEPPREPETVSDAAERGPFKFMVAVSPKEVWLGDPLTIDLRVHTPDGYRIEFPSIEDLGDVVIRDSEEREARPAAEGGLDWRRTYTAYSFASGELEIPPLTVKYARRPAPDADAEAPVAWENELVTGTLKVRVRSALTSQDSVRQPREITGTLLPDWRLKPIYGVMIAGAVVVAALLTYVVYRLIRRRLSRPPPPVLPEVWALRELAKLSASDWMETGRVREYYYALTAIVCTYIERKFALAAPEMTTEEFLNALARDRNALPYDADRLREFLRVCDIVKYAAFNPRKEDAEQALRTARAFIDATAEDATGRVATGGRAA